MINSITRYTDNMELTLRYVDMSTAVSADSYKLTRALSFNINSTTPWTVVIRYLRSHFHFVVCKVLQLSDNVSFPTAAYIYDDRIRSFQSAGGQLYARDLISDNGRICTSRPYDFDKCVVSIADFSDLNVAGTTDVTWERRESMACIRNKTRLRNITTFLYTNRSGQ